jgi:hypothetical protein
MQTKKLNIIFLVKMVRRLLLKYFIINLGNGGEMLKIYTFLTDQEIAYLKFMRRTAWHGTKLEPNHHLMEGTPITDQELDHLGLKLPREPYVEYNKRPPHDFYL